MSRTTHNHHTNSASTKQHTQNSKLCFGMLGYKLVCQSTRKFCNTNVSNQIILILPGVCLCSVVTEAIFNGLVDSDIPNICIIGILIIGIG